MNEPRSQNSFYTETAIRAALAAIPHIGGSLIEIGFEHRSRVKAERVYEFVNELKTLFAQLSEDKIDYDFVLTNHFADIVEEIIDRVSKTDNANKRARFKQLLLGTTIPGAKTEQFEIFFELTSKLNDNQITLLNKFYDAKPKIQNLELEVLELEEDLKLSKQKEKEFILKAEKGTITPTESIAYAINNSVRIEKEMIIRKNQINQLMTIERLDLFGISDRDATVLVDDLLAKRLILNVSPIIYSEKQSQYERLAISPLGYSYISYLKGN